LKVYQSARGVVTSAKRQFNQINLTPCHPERHLATLGAR